MAKLEVNRIIGQVKKLYNNNWSGFDLHLLLNSIEDNTANKKLPLFSNTIHQIANHILASEFVVIQRLQGVNYQLSLEEDWTPSDQLVQVKWADTKAAILKSKDDLIRALEKKVDNDLDQPILKNFSSIYDTIHGHIQHSYYHLGQISTMFNAIQHLNTSIK